MRTTARWLDWIAPALLLALASRGAVAQEKPPAALAPDRLAALDRISADSLRGHLSFLASDLLEGRDTPSRGLDLAAEYIAAQFRRAGLEAVGDDGYFQTATWEVERPEPSSFRLEVAAEGHSIRVQADRVSLARVVGFDVAASGVFKVDFRAEAGPAPGAVAGQVVLVELPDARKVGRADPPRPRRVPGPDDGGQGGPGPQHRPRRRRRRAGPRPAGRPPGSPRAGAVGGRTDDRRP